MIRFYPVLALLGFSLLLMGQASRERTATGGTPTPAEASGAEQIERRLDARDPSTLRRRRTGEVQGSDPRQQTIQPDLSDDAGTRELLEEAGSAARAAERRSIQQQSKQPATSEAVRARAPPDSGNTARSLPPIATQQQPARSQSSDEDRLRALLESQGVAPSAGGLVPIHPDAFDSTRMREILESQGAARAAGRGGPPQRSSPSNTGARMRELVEDQDAASSARRSNQPRTSETGARMRELLEAQESREGSGAAQP